MPSPLSDLDLAKMLCVEGGRAALPFFRGSIAAENKATGGLYDPVTEGDRAAERTIRDLLFKHRPDDGILGEEFGKHPGQNTRQWVIDPIDGTRAFVSGSPTWGTLVGLTDAGGHEVGAAGQANVGDIFTGDSQSAWLNGQPIRTRDYVARSELRISTTDVVWLTDEMTAKFEQLSNQVAIRRFGLDWYAYALLACGGFDVVLETGLQAYDIAALIPIIRGAGGIVTDVTGGDDIGPTVLACANARLHAEMLEFLNG